MFEYPFIAELTGMVVQEYERAWAPDESTTTLAATVMNRIVNIEDKRV
jgi:hypothetical protein